MNLNHIFGTHSSFFYYGLGHLYINLINYIKEGLENNELIYVYMFPQMYNDFIKILKASNIDTINIKFKSLEELILINSSKDLKELDKITNNIISEALNEEFSGIRLISQVSFAISKTSKKKFLEFENVLNKLFSNKKGSILCIYDMEDYSHGNKYINTSIIKASFSNHSHIMSEFKLNKIEGFE